jgi:molecular chaperone HtpG
LATLDEMRRESMKEYLELWAAFGPVLKEGLLGYDTDDSSKLLDLVLASSTANPAQLTTLDEYVGRMKEGQDAIYYLTGAKDAVAKSPLLEAFTDQGYEVLLFSDSVDELWLERAPKYKEKRFQSIGRGEVQLGDGDDRKKASEALKAKEDELRDLLGCLRVRLQEEVKEVRLSGRLTSSPVCLVTDEHDLSPRMQKLLEQLGQKPPKSKVILEINPNHALIPKLQAIFKESPTDPRLTLYAELLLGQAHLADSGQLPDPAAFSKAVADVMVRAI